MDRAAEEQRSTFYPVAAELRMNYQITKIKIKLARKNTYEPLLLLQQQQLFLATVKKGQIQAPGTTFSTLSDEVRLERGHGNCCRFATLTELHQGAHIFLAKLWLKAKVRS